MPLIKNDGTRDAIENIAKRAKDAPFGDEAELIDRLAWVESGSTDPQRLRAALKELYTLVFYLRAELRSHILDSE
jgi:hypothetical protein